MNKISTTLRLLLAAFITTPILLLGATTASAETLTGTTGTLTPNCPKTQTTPCETGTLEVTSDNGTRYRVPWKLDKPVPEKLAIDTITTDDRKTTTVVADSNTQQEVQQQIQDQENANNMWTNIFYGVLLAVMLIALGFMILSSFVW